MTKHIKPCFGGLSEFPAMETAHPKLSLTCSEHESRGKKTKEKERSGAESGNNQDWNEDKTEKKTGERKQKSTRAQ